MRGSTAAWEQMHLHRSYVEDRPRTAAYDAALRRHVGPADFVLDVGSGTGFLACLAAQAGAGYVMGVEWSSLVTTARRIARANGLDIDFLHADARDLHLSRPADLVVHDLVGTFLWNEDMVDVMRHVREHLLKPGGRIVPGRVDLLVAPVTSPERAVVADFWSRPHHGLDLSAAGERELAGLTAPMFTAVAGDDCLLGPPVRIAEVDLHVAAGIPRTLEADLQIARDGLYDAVLGFLEIHFDERTVLRTGPLDAPTGWGQMLGHLPEPRAVTAGDRVRLRIRPALKSRDWRFESQVAHRHQPEGGLTHVH